MWGYANFCEAMANKKHPEYEELKEWYGGKYDPEKFVLAEVNKYFGIKSAKAKKPTVKKAVKKAVK